MDRDRSVVEFSVDKIRLTNDGKERHKVIFHVQNRCSASKRVRVAVDKHSDSVFRLLSGHDEHYLAAGLKLPVVLQYAPNEEGAHCGELHVYADDCLMIAVPIEALPPCPVLEVSPQTLDFGILVAEHQIVSKTFTITNTGSKEGAFSVHSGNLPPQFAISPLEGTISPRQWIEVKVELLCKEEGTFSEALGILSGDVLVSVTICGSIQSRKLELLECHSHSPMELVAFGPTYYGTVLNQRAILYNNSPVNTDFLAVLDEQTAGTEHGVDTGEGLAMACTPAGLGQTRWREQGFSPPCESLISITPLQGTLGPYEKKVVEFTFSPTFQQSELGWTSHQGLPTQRKYALFIRFLCVGGTQLRGKPDPLEVAVTGTSLPVDLKVEPCNTLDFGECTVGSCDTQQIWLCNDSGVLPLEFCCRQVPHYKCEPSTGKVEPGNRMKLSILFQPKQLGPLTFKLSIDVLGYHSLVRGKPKVAVVHTALIELKGSGGASQVGGKKTRRVNLTHPDDLATSVRPHDGSVKVRTPHTRVSRHTYVDPDYTYPEEERAQHQEHRDSYTHFIRQRHSERMWRKKERVHSNPAYSNSTDLGMPPAHGLHPPKLHVAVSPSKKTGTLSPRTPWNPTSRTSSGRAGEQGILTARDLLTATSLKLEHVSQCATKPSSPEIATQCRTILLPEELNQVALDPHILDFGRVVVNHNWEQNLLVKNFLSKHISVKLKVAGTELDCSQYPTALSHLNLILPPLSYTTVPFSFQHKSTGPFDRSLEYCINGHHTSHLPVRAVVVRLTLRLSTNTLTLTEPYLATPTSGLRGSVVVTNEHSVSASFQWHAREGVDTNVFIMMHPSGVVPPRSSLECEFICQPSYGCPGSAQFMLAVEGEDAPGEPPASNVITLLTQFGKPSCVFREKRVLFGLVPLNLSTIQTVRLENKGEHHAYFQVVDPTPYPGMQVYPKSGSVPVGGTTELKLMFHPNSVDKFDAKLSVHFWEGKTLTLKLAGAVEKPTVCIDKELFRFGGVFCGAKATIPFYITNKACTRTQLTFDLSFLTDFFLTLPKEDDPYAEVVSELPTAEYPGVYTLELPGKTRVQCQLHFSPKDVAAYDFHLPVLVNGLRPPSPPPSPWPPSQRPSKVSLISEHQEAFPSFDCTPSRRVLATTLKHPLLVSHTVFKFVMPARYLETMTEPAHHPQVVKLSNESEEPLTWALDLSGLKRVQDGTFQFALHSGVPFTPPSPSSSPAPGDIGHLKPGKSFNFTVLCNPAHHGTFSASVPLLVNGNRTQPYRSLELSAEVPSGRISINPAHIAIQPVPLGISLTAQFLVSVQGFAGPVDLEAIAPPFESHVCFAVRFPEGSHVEECRQKAVELPCLLEFSSNEPLSRTDNLVFCDQNTGKRKKVPFTVAADNSIFTVYEFLAQNFNNASIKLSQSNTPRLALHGAKDLHVASDSSISLSSTSLKEVGPSLTASSTFGDMFLQDCVAAMCRWLSVYGWAEGVKNVNVPINLRKKVGHDLPKPGIKQRSSINTSKGILVDMLTHICGRLPPGIPMNPPPCTNPSEKVNQQYSTYSTVLTFLKNQGGLPWTVVPEALLDYFDWQQWVKDTGGSLFQPASEDEFEELSKQAWTHLLLQIVKVLVLPRMTLHIPKVLRQKVTKMDPLESNVYSKPERILLAWLNHHYQQQKHKIFRDQSQLEREVVNFEVDLMDCVVLACVLAAYCPYLASHFFQLYAEPSTPEQCSHNAVVFVKALHHTGIDYDCQPNDLCSANPVWMILFCGYLYQHLPRFIPKTTISFTGTLHGTIAQQVHVENPSAKLLEYRVLIRGESSGSENFAITHSNDTIVVPGRGNTTVDVKFNGKHMQPSTATLLLVPKGGRAAMGSTLAFKLEASVSGAKPQTSVNVTAPLYEPQLVTLEATSPFLEGGEFEVRLFESGDKNLLFTTSPRSRRKHGPRSPSLIPSSSLQERSSDRMQLFHCTAPRVHMQPNKSIQIQIQFVPVKMEPRHCAVMITNNKIGEIILSVTALVKLPYPFIPQSRLLDPHTVVNKNTKTVHLKAHAGQKVHEEIVVQSRNGAFEKALLELSKWDMSSTELKHRLLAQSLQHAALSAAVATLGLHDKPKTYRDKLTDDSDKLVFTVQGGNEYFGLPEVIAVPGNQRGSAILPVKFLAEEEGQYECHVVLRSEHDIRILVIESTVMARGRQTVLEFCTPAMQPLTQEIPLVNPSTVDWPLQAAITGTGFSGPEFLVAKALCTTSYSLIFNPRKAGTVEGELHLVNTDDGSEHVFQLKGIADRPLAQEQITLHGQAKSSFTHILHVPNYNERTMVFRVESDLDFVSGPATVAIGGGDVVDYPLTILPKKQGTFTGAIAFVAQAISRPYSGFGESLNIAPSEDAPHHVWFHLECHVDPGPPDHVIPLSCHTLSSTTVQLTVVNPHSQPLSLEVLVEGHGLFGPEKLDVELCGEATYPLTFSPTVVGKNKGRVVFNGSPDGEIWYEVRLASMDPKPVTLPQVKCELGRTCQQNVTLFNPLDERVTFSCQFTNAKHFVVSGLSEGEVTVGAGASVDVPILFKPSALGAGEHVAEISFLSDQFGTQVFTIQGEGLPPSAIDSTTVTASLSSNVVHIINFTNPLDVSTYFSVSLKGEDTDHFCLLMKRTHAILLHPGVSLDIPVMFAPEAMYKHQVSVVVSAESREQLPSSLLTWQFPIIGQPEFRPFSPKSAPKLTCFAKERVEQRLEVILVGSNTSQAAQVRPITPGTNPDASDPTADSVGGENYTYQLVCSNHKFTSLVKNSTGIKLIRRTTKLDDGTVTLVFNIVFVPPRAFSCVAELHVMSASGGVWKFPLALSATMAVPDDIITLEAEGLNKETQVGFRLTSMSEHPAPFTAHLAPGSDTELSVHPTTGELAPINTKGTLFYISYKPTSYGRDHHAKLIVQCESNEWIYEVVGRPPSHSPPTTTPSRVQHKGSPLRTPSKKNFVRNNMKLTSRISAK